MSGFIFSDPVFRAFVLLVFGFDLFRFSFGILRPGWPTFCDPAMPDLLPANTSSRN